jgi:hypothetical protein
MRESLARKKGIKVSKNNSHSHSHSHSHSLSDEDLDDFSIRIRLRNMAIQHIGFLTGFTCMLIIALYADKISL